MNFLAHLYLAGEPSYLKVGGFLGDFVKGPLYGKYPEDIELGIHLHRKIDSWSDTQTCLKLYRDLLPPEYSRYKGIIADVFCDHVLASNWTNYSEGTVDQFADLSISQLSASEKLFPEKAKTIFERMVTGSWLTNYHSLDYCLGALARIGKRLNHANPLHKLERPLNQNYQQFEQVSHQILHNLEMNVSEWRAENLDAFLTRG